MEIFFSDWTIIESDKGEAVNTSSKSAEIETQPVLISVIPFN